MARVTRSKRRGSSGDVATFGSAGARPLLASDAPDHMGETALAKWNELVAGCNEPNKPPRFLLTDAAIVAAFCDHYGDYQAARRLVSETTLALQHEGQLVQNIMLKISSHAAQQMRLLGVELGLTPASRPRVHRPRETPQPAADVGSHPPDAPSPAPPSRLARLKVVG